MNAACYIEIGPESLLAVNDATALELPVERQPNGRLTAACKQRLAAGLENFLGKRVWPARPKVICAIPARGVSVRILTLPVSSKDELQRLMQLQIESEFPLPPDELAWGFERLAERAAKPGAAKQDLMVVAVKKDLVEDYAEIFANAGVHPVFTLAALARGHLCQRPPATYGVLNISRTNSELVTFDQSIPASVRVLPWGTDDITKCLEHKLALSHEEAEKLRIKLDQEPSSSCESRVQEAFEATVANLMSLMNGQCVGRKIYLSGAGMRHQEFRTQLSKRVGLNCEQLELAPGATGSAAILGLQKAERDGGPPPLWLRLKQANGSASASRPAPWKWAAVAAALALLAISFPYLEALLLKPGLTKRLSRIKADKGRLAIIDRDLNFLRYLKENQPPYLDTMYVLAKSAPQGSRIDSLSMNRRGDLAIRGSMKDSQQVGDFRSKLVDSGLFANVSVEEQTPTPDRQKVNVRMSAQWKPAAARQGLAIGPTPEEIEKAKTSAKDKPGQFPGMPPGFPPGFPGGDMGGMPGPMPPGAFPSRPRPARVMRTPDGSPGPGPMPSQP